MSSSDLEKSSKTELELREEDEGLDVEEGAADDTLSALTMAAPSGEGPFDLERFLRKAMKQ